MARVWLDTSWLRSMERPSTGRASGGVGTKPDRLWITTSAVRWIAVFLGCCAVYAVYYIHSHYTFSLQTPVQLRFRSPLVVSRRAAPSIAAPAQSDQPSSLTAYQQYACKKFGSQCRIALAIQRSENPQGKCEVYHYNADGTLDWGYFQINTVHLKRPGVNLRDLLDCKTNIDFAYKLYRERGNFTAWSTYNNGRYRRQLTE
jgi:hypothetical protein